MKNKRTYPTAVSSRVTCLSKPYLVAKISLN